MLINKVSVTPIKSMCYQETIHLPINEGLLQGLLMLKGQKYYLLINAYYKD